MCRRRIPWGAAVLLLLALPIEAQQASYLLADERVRIEAELAELDALWIAFQAVEAQRLAEAEVRVRQVQQRQVTEQVGPVDVVGEAGLVAIAVPHVRNGLGSIEEITGDLGFLPTLRLEVYQPDQLGFANVNSGQPTGLRRIAVEGRGSGSEIRGIVRQHVLYHMPAPLAQWAQGWGWDSSFSPRVGFQSLLESTHPDGVRCLQGDDVGACARFLFLGYDGSSESSMAALSAWYPQGFRAKSEQQFFARIEELLTACASRTEVRLPALNEDGIHTACLAELEHQSVFSFVPAHGAARGSVLAFALSSADPGGIEAALALPEGTSVGDQLATIAGIPLDQLVTDWRESISVSGTIFEVGRPGSGRGPFTLLWAGGLALIALRSTRWRLG